jgi:hypothetical protein
MLVHATGDSVKRDGDQLGLEAIGRSPVMALGASRMS